MEWTHTRPPRGVPIHIFNHYGQVRYGVSDGIFVRLRDCTDPMQNSVYPTDYVIAWRLPAFLPVV